MKDDYISETERKAYRKGIADSNNGATKYENPYVLPRNRLCWLEGFNEKGSIAEKSK